MSSLLRGVGMLVTEIEISLKNRQTPQCACFNWASPTIEFNFNLRYFYFRFPITDTDMSKMLYDMK